MSTKRRHHRRKPLSAAEQERRKQLHDERVRRKKREKRLFWLKLLIIALLVLLLISINIILAFIGHTRAMCVLDTILGLIAATLTDRSGIREILFSWYPERFLFSSTLKKHIPDRSFLIELARTICYYAVGAMLLWNRLCDFCAPICVITIVIGYVYLIFDQNDRYTFDKFSKCSDTMMYLIIVGLFGLEYSYAVHEAALDIPISAVVIGSILVTAAYLLFARSDKKIERAIETLFFSAIDIISIIAFIQLIWI